MILLSSSLLTPEICRLFCRSFCLSRILLATHYDTLKLKQDCTTKEIRESFLNLSKQIHPDKTNNPNNHAEFVKLNEAYSILSKPHRRVSYDASLWGSTKYKQDWHRNGNFKDESFWENRDRFHDRHYQKRWYYGISGLKKVPNSWIVAFCIVFSLTGVGLQAMAIRSSVTFEREKLDEFSVKNSLMHSAVRQQAKDNGNEVQLELLRKRLPEGHTAILTQSDHHANPKNQVNKTSANI